MPSTYTPIATYTFPSDAATFTFSSIPSTYTDLIIVSSTAVTTAWDITFRLNGDTGNNYSFTSVYGYSSSSVGSNRFANLSLGYFDAESFPTGTLGENIARVHFMNYSNTTTYKTIISRSGTATRNIDATVNLWRSTAAINSITVGVSSNLVKAGSTMTLYGIKAA